MGKSTVPPLPAGACQPVPGQLAAPSPPGDVGDFFAVRFEPVPVTMLVRDGDPVRARAGVRDRAVPEIAAVTLGVAEEACRPALPRAWAGASDRPCP